MDFLENFYAATLASLEESKNDVSLPSLPPHWGIPAIPHPFQILPLSFCYQRLAFKTNLKLAKVWLDRGEFVRLGKILKQLHIGCQNADGSDDSKKGTQLLEVYALEIQMYTATKNNKKLKELYKLSLHIKSAIPHPKIMGIIRECGGKMHMSEGECLPPPPPNSGNLS